MASTIKEVAKLANVSTSTVSAVLNGRFAVKSETYERIMKAIEELDFRPNALAKGLRMNTSKTIGLVIPTIINPYFPRIAYGVEATAREYNYHVFLCNSERQRDRQREYLQTAVSKAMDGIILCNIDPDIEDLKKLDENRIAVASTEPIAIEYADIVQIDHAMVARKAVSYAVSLGHEHIAFINNDIKTYRAIERDRAIREVYADYGMDIGEHMYMYHRSPSPQYVKDCMDDILSKTNRPTCIISMSEVAVPAMHYALAKGLKIPDDISFISTDNAVESYPAMTGVDYNGYELGRLLAEKVINRSVSAERIPKTTTFIEQRFINGGTLKSLNGGNVDFSKA